MGDAEKHLLEKLERQLALTSRVENPLLCDLSSDLRFAVERCKHLVDALEQFGVLFLAEGLGDVGLGGGFAALVEQLPILSADCFKLRRHLDSALLSL